MRPNVRLKFKVDFVFVYFPKDRRINFSFFLLPLLQPTEAFFPIPGKPQACPASGALHLLFPLPWTLAAQISPGLAPSPSRLSFLQETLSARHPLAPHPPNLPHGTYRAFKLHCSLVYHPPHPREWTAGAFIFIAELDECSPKGRCG